MAESVHIGTRGEDVHLIGRQQECDLLDRMVAAVGAGESRVLVVRGAPGVGKSALLAHATAGAGELRVITAPGNESEMELAFATLHRLCAPVIERLGRLPARQRAALEIVFGMRDGHPPDSFLLGPAVLGLLAEAARERPLLCMIDDAQWMDSASAPVLAFVARRLLAESIGLVFAARGRVRELLGLPELAVTGLAESDAGALLSAVTPGRLDQPIRDRIVAETRGNPLALLELTRGRTVTQLAGGLGLVTTGPPPGEPAADLPAGWARLPAQSRLFALLAAAEPAGDPGLIERAAGVLGIAPAAALAEGAEGLLTVGERVIFRHSGGRSAVYSAAEAAQRRSVHLALARATDQREAPDQRAWHLAAAASGPDEAVAAELERFAGQAGVRGGLAAAAAFLQRSVALTGDSTARAERAVAAAEASLGAGDIAAARRFVRVADLAAQTDLQYARAHLVRSRIAFAAGLDDVAPALLLAAARRLEPFDLSLAREAYLLAWGAAALFATDRPALVAISERIKVLPAPAQPPGVLDLLLPACALLVTDGRAAAVPLLRQAMAALTELPASQLPSWAWVANGVIAAAWDERSLLEVRRRAVEVVRDSGALTELSFCLASLGAMLAWTGDLAGAGDLAAQAGLTAATGGLLAPSVQVELSALRGREEEAEPLIAAVIDEARAAGRGRGVTVAQWAAAVLYNGLGRYADARELAQDCAEGAAFFVATWALPELIEAAVRVGDDTAARAALAELAEATEPCGTDWALGVLARSRALLAHGRVAEDHYGEAIERLGRTALRPDLARAHLLYGEWLRRDRRRVEARHQLRTAYEMFAAIGMEAFAERARRELLATGEAVRKRATAGPSSELTAQERQIALLVRDGYSNPEVAARLFLSPRTVEWHLRKIFAKLSITSRRQLRGMLPGDEYEMIPE